MPPQRKPAKKRTATKPKREPSGPLAKTFLQNLKTMPPGTPDRTIMLETLRSVPPEKLKAALAKAPPRARNLLFNLIPADQIRPIVGSLPPATIGPAEPPSPPPSPVGGPPADILMTTYTNVPYPPAESDLDWAQKITNGITVQDYSLGGPNAFEWTPVYDQSFEREGSLNNPVVGLTGWVVAHQPSPLSSEDVWFTHPFGADWEYYIVPDPQYEGLLTVSNTGALAGHTDSEYDAATKRAKEVLGLDAPFGVLGVEIDQDLVPQTFRDRVTDGARIATFGRWIVDSGHPDFHTEIHPPLLTAVATPMPPPQGVRGASQMTHVELMSRPYTVSQRFPEGNFVEHLIAEVAKVETTILGIPLSLRVEAHPTVYTTPYEGRPFMKLLVKPPVPRGKRGLGGLEQLIVNFHFTCRQGIAVRVFDAGNDTVGIFIVLGDLNPAELPPKHDFEVDWDQIQGGKYNWIIDVLQLVDLILDPIGALVLERSILTDRYDAPIAASSVDFQNVAGPMPVGQVDQWVGLSEDDGQPFPIYGWMNVYWEEQQIVAEP